jgi:hypothetical protein
MKKIAFFLIAAYALLFVVLTWHVVILSFLSQEKELVIFFFNLKSPSESELNMLKDILKILLEPSYWVFISILLVCQAGLLFIPVKVAASRPIKRRSVYFPIIVGGLLAGALFLGVVFSISEFLMQKKSFGEAWQIWTAIGSSVIIWLVWIFVFSRISKGKDPKNFILKQCKYLLYGSIVTLLVAVPTHIVARHRNYCCAGFHTFVGITFGIAVMLLSFGPGIFFLYVERWKKLHPEGKEKKGG